MIGKTPPVGKGLTDLSKLRGERGGRGFTGTPGSNSNSEDGWKGPQFEAAAVMCFCVS